MKTVLFELKRNWILLLISLFLIFPNFRIDFQGLQVISYALGMVTLILLFIHIWRKFAFPYLNIGTLIDKTTENPIAAAIVVTGAFYLFAAVLQVTVGLLK